MSRINDLIRQVALKDETLAADLQREVSALADRRSFGLNFERHVPEAVELPGRPVRRGDKVRILPPRGDARTAANDRLWQVVSLNRSDDPVTAHVTSLVDGSDATVAAADLVVVAEFRDPIYPGLVSTGKVERGGDKPFHTVINAENFHALQALLFTHRGKIDCIYIDPPYNSGAKDWKYNNDYVEGDDLYRHSKWLAFMERRLLLAKELLNPGDSVLIVTIDEKEYLRLGLLLEQTFPQGRIQMVTSVVNPFGVARAGQFSRVEEYIYVVAFGHASPSLSAISTLDVGGSDGPLVEESRETFWFSFMRAGSNSSRSHSPGCFYPIFVSSKSGQIVGVGRPLRRGQSPSQEGAPQDAYAAWPINEAGEEAVWQASAEQAEFLLASGFIRAGRYSKKIGRHSITYLREGTIRALQSGELSMIDGEVERIDKKGRLVPGKSVWNISSHNATSQGTKLLNRILPGRSFPYPKSVYAVEDVLRFFVGARRDALIADFFSGSGTTAHAVMRLNKQDGGHRQCISVTNNEVSADEQKALLEDGLRPGDPEWEGHGICEFITKPRIRAAVTGLTPNGDPIKGDYKFTDEFPMADGLEENVEFFTLTYEAPLRVASNRDFARISPLLWMRAGSRGRRIEDVSTGWDVADVYGVLADLDQVEPFLHALAEREEAAVAFIVTDEDRLFETVVRQLPDGVEPVRLYESYLRNFELEAGRGLR